MSLLSRLVHRFAPKAAEAAPPEEAERLAVAALLLHVARIDGTVVGAERARLEAILAERVGPEAVGRLVAAGGELDYESGDIGPLVEMLGHDAGPQERRRILELAWQVAASDGRVHEFEDGLLWRLGRALGLDDATLAGARSAALQDLPAGGGP